MSVFVPSVRHTGTHFVLRYVADCCEGESVIRRHFDPRHRRLIADTAAKFATVVPLRDPLLSLRSTLVRGGDINRTLGQWAELCRLPAKDWLFLPVDQIGAKPQADRHAALLDVARHVGGEELPADRWADEWPIIGSRGLSVAVPGLVTYLLRRSEPWLRPFLERRGYSRLSWWY